MTSQARDLSAADEFGSSMVSRAAQYRSVSASLRSSRNGIAQLMGSTALSLDLSDQRTLPLRRVAAARRCAPAIIVAARRSSSERIHSANCAAQSFGGMSCGARVVVLWVPRTVQIIAETAARVEHEHTRDCVSPRSQGTTDVP